ncbi:hypothetical protein MKZ38_000740 [Zalerion maritima]|uniref:MYND-type domain-containing protein n=1 Tax=Zalerion maritima TaxID=339359 RepID=A0AAD5WU87_9PEZI|nr:hypothetical protein MKZ38_000740 [Zalerion maritima]
MVEACQLDIGDEELVLWKQVMPALIERCRTWEHNPQNCRRGHGLDDFVAIPDWSTAAKYATRIALNPTFGAPIVEEGHPDLRDVLRQTSLESSSEARSDSVSSSQGGPSYWKCGATGGRGGGDLMSCSRCKTISYCSADC